MTTRINDDIAVTTIYVVERFGAKREACVRLQLKGSDGIGDVAIDDAGTALANFFADLWDNPTMAYTEAEYAELAGKKALVEALASVEPVDRGMGPEALPVGQSSPVKKARGKAKTLSTSVTSAPLTGRDLGAGGPVVGMGEPDVF